MTKVDKTKALKTVLNIYIAALVFAAVLGLAVMLLPTRSRAEDSPQNGWHIYVDLITSSRQAVLSYTKVQPFTTLEACKKFVETDKTLHDDMMRLAKDAAKGQHNKGVVLVGARCSTTPLGTPGAKPAESPKGGT